MRTSQLCVLMVVAKASITSSTNTDGLHAAFPTTYSWPGNITSFNDSSLSTSNPASLVTGPTISSFWGSPTTYLNTSTSFAGNSGLASSSNQSLNSSVPRTTGLSSTSSGVVLSAVSSSLNTPGISSPPNSSFSGSISVRTPSSVAPTASSGGSTPSEVKPSIASTLPSPTTSSLNSSTSSSRPVGNPIDEQPIILTVTSVVSGTTQLLPVLSGGAFTSAVIITASPTSLDATGIAASSSAIALSSSINVNIIPVIKAWADNPAGDKADKATSAIKDILPDAEKFLKSLGGDGTSSSCTDSKKRALIAKGLPNPFKLVKDIIHAVSCITNTLNKVTGEIESGVNAVKGVLGDIGDLTSLTKSLDQEENGDDDDQTETESASESDSQTSASETSALSSSTMPSSSSSSSQSCTQSSTTQDIYVECSPTIVSGSANVSFVTEQCITSTSTVSGCAITAFTTTPTASETGSYATDIVTLDLGLNSGDTDSPLDDAWISSVMSEISANATSKGNATATINSTSALASISSGSSSAGIRSSSFLSSNETTFVTTTSSSLTVGSLSQPEPSTSLSSSFSSSSSSSSSSTSISQQSTSTTAPAPPPPASSTVAPPLPWKTGVCSVHIKESVNDATSKTFDMTAEIKDAEGNSLGSTSQTVSWDATIIVYSKLPYNVDITFTTRTSKKRESGTNLWRRLGGYVPPPPPPNLFEKNIVTVQASHQWNFDTTQTDKSKLPYMNVGGWDNSKYPVNRQMDGYWSC